MTRMAAALCLIVVSFAATPAPAQNAPTSCRHYAPWVAAKGAVDRAKSQFLQTRNCAAIPPLLNAIRRFNAITQQAYRDCPEARSGTFRRATTSVPELERTLRSHCR